MRPLVPIIALLIMLGLPCPGQAAKISSMPQLKSAYLYNFAKFIHWPKDAFADAQSPLIIGILGQNPFSTELTPLTARKIRNRPIKIFQFNNVEETVDCHLLYISPSLSDSLQQILATLHSTSTITIGDDKNFANLGGAIQFVTRRERLRFIINLKATKAKNIKIDSQLLSLAVEVLEAQQ